MENDPVIQFIIAEIKENNGIILQSDIVLFLNFLATMSIGCKKMAMPEIGELYSTRLNTFVLLLHKMGYKNTKRLKGTTTFGLQSILSKSFYNLRVFE